jgi:hypothetical protein
MDWTVPPGGTGMDCGANGVEPSSPDYFRVAWTSQDGAVIGAASDRADQVELVTKSGSHSGEVYSAPSDLGLPVKFFVVFGDFRKGTELLVKDATGSVICKVIHPTRRRIERGM